MVYSVYKDGFNWFEIAIHRLLKMILVELENMIKVDKISHYLVLKYSIITNCSDISVSSKISKHSASDDLSNHIMLNF